ncbi:MAG: hypothetical protein GY738_27305, partial [Pseudoalteromonas sp.]|nr:hypothetical protein [Pseudoalteromonas sp.]
SGALGKSGIITCGNPTTDQPDPKKGSEATTPATAPASGGAGQSAAQFSAAVGSGGGASGGDDGDEDKRQPPKKPPEDDIVIVIDQEEEEKAAESSAVDDSIMVDPGAAESAQSQPMDDTIMPQEVTTGSSTQPMEESQETEEDILRVTADDAMIPVIPIEEDEEDELLGIVTHVPIAVPSETDPDSIDPTSNLKVPFVHRGDASVVDQ